MELGLHNMDCLVGLRQMNDESVDLTMTLFQGVMK